MSTEVVMTGKQSRYAQNREAIKRETRKALLDAAARLFSRKGIDVSLDDICAEAGYTRGAFYVHFKNRDDLLAQVMEGAGNSVLDYLLGPEEAPGDDLSALVGRFVDALTQGRLPLSGKEGIRFHQFLNACARSTNIRKQYQTNMQRAHQRLARLLRQLQQQGKLRAGVDNDALAALIMTLVMGAQAFSDMDVAMPFEEGAATLLQLLLPTT